MRSGKNKEMEIVVSEVGNVKKSALVRSRQQNKLEEGKQSITDSH